MNSQATRGTHTRFSNPSSNAIEAIYWEMPEAKVKVGRGLHCVFYDTTHGTNPCKMKLGMFIASNEDGRSVVLAVSYDGKKAKRFTVTFTVFFYER